MKIGHADNRTAKSRYPIGLIQVVAVLFSVLAARTLFAAADVIPPSLISNLAASNATSDTVTLTWTATGDDGSSGQAAAYDLRFSYQTITAGNFSQAEAIATNLTPKPAGQAETYIVRGLIPDETYYFALKAIDEAGNPSTISNIAQGDSLTVTQFRSPYTDYLGKNLFLDGNFETGEDHFNLMRMMAAEDYPGGALDYREVVFDTTPANVVQGQTSLKFQNGNVGLAGSSKNDYAMLEFNWLKLADSTTHTFSFWGKAADFGGASYRIVSNLKDLNGNAIAGCPSTGFDLTTSWQRFTATCTTGTGVPNQMYHFYFTSGTNSYSIPRSTTNAKSTIWLDGIQLEAGASATTYENPLGLGIGVDTNIEEPLYFTQDLAGGQDIILSSKLFYDTAADTAKTFVLRYYLKNNFDQTIASETVTLTFQDGVGQTLTINVSDLLAAQAPEYTAKKGMYKFFLYALEDGNDPGPIINREEFVYGVATRNTSGPNPDSPFGTHFELGSMVGGLGHGAIIGSDHENHFELAEAIGFKQLRDFTLARWDGIQRDESDAIAWWDEFATQAQTHGLNLMPILNLFTPPDWATALDANGQEIRSNPYAIWFDWQFRLADPDRVATFVSQIVDHYKATIHNWEVVNEPAFAALPREYYQHFLEPAYDAAKAADPTASIIGPDPGAGSGWGYWDTNFIQDLAALDGAGFNHLDRVSLHMYDNNGLPPENPGTLFSLPYPDHRQWQANKIRAIDPDIPIDDTESGFQQPTLYSDKSFHGDGGNAIGGTALVGNFYDPYSGSFANSVRVAQYQSRLTLMKLANEVDRIYNFSLRAQQSIANMGGLTLTHYDGEPTTSLLSLGAMMDILDTVDLSSVTDIPYDRLKTADSQPVDDGTTGYVFQRNDGQAVLAAWNWEEDSSRAPEATFVNASINLDPAKITAFDFLGNQLTLASNGQGGVVIPLGNSPTYIVSSGSGGSYTYGQFVPLVKSATSLAGLPAAPSNLTSTTSGTPTAPVIQLTWEGPSDTTGITGYHLYRRVNFGDESDFVLLNDNDGDGNDRIELGVTSYTDALPELYNIPGCCTYRSEIFSYRYWLVAVDGSGDESHPVYEIVPDAWHSNTPTSVASGSVTNTTATVTWQTGVRGNDTYQYVLYQDGQEIQRVRHVEDDFSYSNTFSYLTPGTPYTFQVASIDNLHNESPRVDLLVTTTGSPPVVPDTTPPAAVVNLAVTQ